MRKKDRGKKNKREREGERRERGGRGRERKQEGMRKRDRGEREREREGVRQLSHCLLILCLESGDSGQTSYRTAWCCIICQTHSVTAVIEQPHLILNFYAVISQTNKYMDVHHKCFDGSLHR